MLGEVIVRTWEVNPDQRVVLYDDGVFFLQTITRTAEGKRWESVPIDPPWWAADNR